MLRVCFVCLGNICRSPTAEGVMQKLVVDAGLQDRILVDSAGTADYHVGELPDRRTIAAAQRRGIDLTHRGRQFEAGDLVRFDLVLAMDQANLSALQALASGGHRDKLFLLRAFDPTAPSGAEVSDPYYGGADGFEQVLDDCERACQGLLVHLRQRLAHAG